MFIYKEINSWFQSQGILPALENCEMPITGPPVVVRLAEMAN
jgi:hypothetical protein